MKTPLILDGGMGRELNRSGAPFRQPEWSALALIEAPEFVRRAHDAFIAAGADAITTNSYAVVPFHIGEARFRKDGRMLADRAGRIAREAADAAPRKVTVAGSLPPLFGSYRPDLFVEKDAQGIAEILIAGLAPHVDVWLAETQGSIAEAAALRKALGNDPRPFWVSFTLEDGASAMPPRLRSQEPVEDAVRAALAWKAEALLFNCSQPEVMAAALDVAGKTLGDAKLTLGVYANAFPPQDKDAEANAGLSDIRADLDPSRYLSFVQDWLKCGASIVGGCCGIGPEHIAAIRKAVS
ncbi:homocysteine S-methyltransferase family protein [Dongia sedimenti]|uniref:Homocysteine S-methyltransferase family protein n=1 Tax=Dongia sedimenti TaxID=3064282 RepID=A0ABU0YQE7_9PROT|nr:homocysteine S-methyltransferase family protein [Rhodospirillaceae bacterium R-7]